MARSIIGFAAYLFGTSALFSLAGWLLTLPNDLTVAIGYAVVVLWAVLSLYLGAKVFLHISKGL